MEASGSKERPALKETLVLSNQKLSNIAKASKDKTNNFVIEEK